MRSWTRHSSRPRTLIETSRQDKGDLISTECPCPIVLRVDLCSTNKSHLRNKDKLSDCLCLEMNDTPCNNISELSRLHLPFKHELVSYQDYTNTTVTHSPLSHNADHSLTLSKEGRSFDLWTQGLHFRASRAHAGRKARRESPAKADCIFIMQTLLPPL